MTAANIHYLIGWVGASIIVVSFAVAYILTHNGGDEAEREGCDDVPD